MLSLSLRHPLSGRTHGSLFCIPLVFRYYIYYVLIIPDRILVTARICIKQIGLILFSLNHVQHDYTNHVIRHYSIPSASTNGHHAIKICYLYTGSLIYYIYYYTYYLHTYT